MNFSSRPSGPQLSREAKAIYHRGHREHREIQISWSFLRVVRAVVKSLLQQRWAQFRHPDGKSFHGYRLDANFAKSIHDEAVAFVVPRQGNIRNGSEFRVVAGFLRYVLDVVRQG